MADPRVSALTEGQIECLFGRRHQYDWKRSRWLRVADDYGRQFFEITVSCKRCKSCEVKQTRVALPNGRAGARVGKPVYAYKEGYRTAAGEDPIDRDELESEFFSRYMPDGL